MALEPPHHFAVGTCRVGAENPCPAPSIRTNDAGTPAFDSAAYMVSPSTIGTTMSASPCTIRVGAEPGETKRIGEYCAASACVNVRVAGNTRAFPHRERSVGGKYATIAATRLDSRSTASEADGSPESGVVPSSRASCPPALPPNTPMRLTSTLYSAACWRMKRTARRMSATISDMGYLGVLPCLTANTVNPFSFNGG